MDGSSNTPVKGVVERSPLRAPDAPASGIRGMEMPTVEEEMEMEDRVKSQGQQISSMQESLIQILAMLKEKESDAPESSGRKAVKGKRKEGGPSSPVSTEGGESEKEEDDLNLGFLEEHLKPSYGKVKGPNILQNPLARSLFRTQVPPNFSSLGLPTYDGSSDPADHLSAFMLKMQLINATDADLCKAFPVTFSGHCRTWYTSLPEGIIEDFEQFATLFSSKFASQRRRKLTVSSLINCKQGREELLTDFYDRWNTIACEVQGISPSVAAGNLRMSTHSRELRRALIKKEHSLKEWTDLDRLVRKAILLEEAMAIEETAKLPNPRERTERKRGSPKRRGRSSEGRGYKPRFAQRDNRKEVYTTSQDGGRDRQNDSSARQTHRREDDRKWCDWHQMPTHDTTECREFKASLKYLAPGDLKSRLDTRPQKEEQRHHRNRSPSPRRRSRTPKRHRSRSRRRERSPIHDRLPPPPRRSPPRRQPRVNEDDVEVITIAGGRKRPRSEGERLIQCLNVHKSEQVDISFSPDELAPEESAEDPLVISLRTRKFKITRALVDNGSSADILFYSTLKSMKMSVQDLKPSSTSLVGFSGSKIRVLGLITLQVTIGEGSITKTRSMDFHVADCPSAYNAILGRGFLSLFSAVPSTCHQTLKFPVGGRIGQAKGNTEQAKECYQATIESLEVDLVDTRGGHPRPEAVEGDAEVVLDSDEPAKKVRISSHLAEEKARELLVLLKEFKDLFAWTSEDMPGVSRELAEHRLSVKSKAKPVQQRRRNASLEKQMALEEEVKRLLKAGFIREVKYPTWLSNPVFVRKASGLWRMCIDFTNQNAACPKDAYPLPRIDQLIDATANHESLSFLDMFSGYHQIRLSEEDQEKTAFMTHMGNFCYTVMPFGLKNAGATYQRMIDAVFKSQLGRNVEAYVDDVLVKSKEEGNHLKDLRETFESLRKEGLRLNPLKCVFGAKAGKFLGFMITRRGIEANPKQIEAITSLRPPRTVKEIQAFNGKMAALSRFIPRSADKCSPFFQMLKKSASRSQWSAECDKAFFQLTEQLTSPPVLSAPKQGEPLYLYLAVSDQAVSSVLVRRDTDGSDHPVYYVSKALLPAERRYMPIERAVLAVVTAARKLRPYFQEHPIVILSNLPLRRILKGMDVSGRMTKWAVELSEYDVTYAPRPSIKGQVLADFIAEGFSLGDEKEENEAWRLFVDGAAGKGGAGAGIVIETPTGVIHEISHRFLELKTNNVAEYEALLSGLKIAVNMGASNLHIHSDSLLVVNQVLESYEVKEEALTKLVGAVRGILSQLDSWKLEHVKREDNHHADALSKLATAMDFEGERQITVTKEAAPTYEVMALNEESQDWRSPLIGYLQSDIVPEEPLLAKALRRKAAHYTMIEGQLCKRSFSGAYLKCLGPEEAKWVIKEIHQGTCATHSGPRSLERTILLQGYYWPTVKKDAMEAVKKCHECQIHANKQHLPSEQLRSITGPWPFAQWGLDLLGPFPTAPLGKKYLVVAVDYFTKWIEAEPLDTITSAKIQKFLFNNIMIRFGTPHTIITDHGTQFDCRPFENFCAKNRIVCKMASVAFPQANGQVESSNKLILRGLKRRLKEAKGGWTAELPHVLWAHRTNYKQATGETPFALTYGAEAVAPTELVLPSLRVQSYDSEDNHKKLLHQLDMIETRRDAALVRTLEEKMKVATAYNAKVKPRPLEEGDLVLKRNFEQKEGHGKLAAAWEGPYLVGEKLGAATYVLATMEGKPLKKTWNAIHLKKYFE
ncbi:unnamed protein product [Linum trigynum]|uniref:Uncharacterized protein n=1 Tax=Linum trigynum TaxID=586398 RepID=A0AAV2G555_9ROSI